MDKPVRIPPATDAEKAQRAERDSVFVQACIRSVDGTHSEVFRVRNISETGMMAEGPIGFDIGRELFIDLRNIGTVRGEVVWSEGLKFGLRFDTPVDPKAVRFQVGGSKA